MRIISNPDKLSYQIRTLEVYIVEYLLPPNHSMFKLCMPNKMCSLIFF